ncbi:MAG: trypsin-like peptidase domain-containing protein [Candidatus Alcyoniella australis]|nr:trypsin-like peptidase domain-containing protein [Candidatus Alcyoniella australis]
MSRWALIAVIALTLWCLSATAQTDERETPVVRAVRAASPAVVNVSTERVVRVPGMPAARDPFFEMFFGDAIGPRTRKTISLGSGVIIDPRGYVLTNEHVIMQSDKISVTLADGREFEARPIGSDSRRDLAVLKIDSPRSLPSIACGSSAGLMIGETVIAIGNPYGLSHTVTTGVLSAVGRNVRLQNNRVYYDFLQTDASINPGNSGGALVNVRGELIGITTAIHDQAQGIGFAVPIDKAKLAYEDLILFGEVHQGWIGLQARTIDAELAEALGLQDQGGLVISAVVRQGPADIAGVQTGDILVGVGTQKIVDPDRLRHVLRQIAVGENVRLKLLRNGRPLSLEARAIEVPPEAVQDIGWRRMGLRIVANSPELAASHGLKMDRGMLVLSVMNGSPAMRAGIAAGDVILMVNQLEISRGDDWSRALSNLSYAEGAILVLGRGNVLRRIALPMMSGD